MTALARMRPEYFVTFSGREIATYAHENVAAFRWDETGAMDRARAEFHRLLPQGLDTPNHHLCEILDQRGGRTLGDLWFEIETAPGANFAYLFNLHIDEQFRRHQHARAALELLEARCRELGAGTLGLHVFAHNTTAQALYGSFGFGVTGFDMVKHLDQA